MQLLTGSMRNYPWGSHTAIAELAGRDAAAKPEAELWLGAHPGGSATIDGEPLVDIIAADPAAQLGAATVAEFGPHLPFLLKLLAAAEPLSLQAHPSKLQAEDGFARDNAAGIPLSAPNRNYKDANHKPELIVALTEFEAMAGFRPVPATKALCAVIGSPQLDHYLSVLDDSDASLQALFTTLITIPAGTRTALIEEIITNIRALDLDAIEPWMAETLSNVVDLAQRYPGDVGVLGALLLNKVTLQPGEGLYLDAGNLHAYVRGLGVEIMANSDNVLRGGLTPKHVDVPELVRVLHFESIEDPTVSTTIDASTTTYQVPINEFALTRVDLAAGEEFTFEHPGKPAILLAITNATARTDATGRADATILNLHPAEAAWVPASDGPVTLAATDAPAQIFIATITLPVRDFSSND